MYKRLFSLLVVLALLLSLTACGASAPASEVAATTLPVYTFTTRLCQGTPIGVTRLVTESVSCLHDYTLQTAQMRAIESAQVIVISGAGLEEFLEDALHSADTVIDASAGLSLLHGEDSHDHDHDHHDDPHIWLSPANAKVMAENICQGLSARFPDYAPLFSSNLTLLLQQLDELQAYGDAQLASLSCREIITFHDGFSYLAESFSLEVLRAVEEESGSEASAFELIELITTVRGHNLPAIFTETNGADAAAKIVSAETGAKLYTLDMAMSGEDYFSAMYHNIDTLREALE